MFWNLMKVHSVSESGMNLKRDINNQMNVDVGFRQLNRKTKTKRH